MIKRPLPRPRRRTDSLGYLWIDGAPYLGPVRVPPLPNRIALTDRVTGAVKVLDQAAGSLDLVDPDPTWLDVTTFGPHDGPYSNGYRLYLSGGSLAFEPAADYNSPRILTRHDAETSVIEITASTSGAVVYTPYEL